MKVHALGRGQPGLELRRPCRRRAITSIYRAPEWLMVPRELAAEMKKIDLRSPAYVGRLARWTRAHSDEVEGLYTSPLHPAAQDARGRRDRRDRRQLRSRRRAPGLRAIPRTTSSTTAAAAMEQFKASVLPDLTDGRSDAWSRPGRAGSARVSEPVPERWSDFRRSRLTALVIKIRTAVKSGAPGGDRQRRGGARRAAGVTSRACRTGAAGSISRCST